MPSFTIPLQVNHLSYRFNLEGKWRYVRQFVAARDHTGRPCLFAVHQINDPGSRSRILSPTPVFFEKVPYPPHLPPPEQIKGPIEVNPFPSVPDQAGVEKYLLMKYDAPEGTPIWERERFVRLPLPWVKISEIPARVGKVAPLTWMLGLVFNRSSETIFNWTVNLFRFQRYNYVDLWLNLIPEGGIQPLHPGDLHPQELRVRNFFPTVKGYPMPVGWLPAGDIFALKRELKPTDLAVVRRQFYVATDPDSGLPTWSPRVLPGGRRVSNAGLGLVKLATINEEGQVVRVETEVPIVIPLENVPGGLLYPHKARTVIEVVPKGKELDVVQGIYPDPKKPSVVKNAYYPLKPGVSLREIAERQGSFWSDDFLGWSPTVEVIQDTTHRVGLNRFSVRITYTNPHNPEQSGSLVIPGSCFEDAEGRDLLQNPNEDRCRLEHIYQREPGHYTEYTARFAPALEQFNGETCLVLTLVKRYRIPQPPELAGVRGQFPDTFVMSIDYAAPTSAVEYNEHYWVPLSLTEPFGDLRNVPPLNYFIYRLTDSTTAQQLQPLLAGGRELSAAIVYSPENLRFTVQTENGLSIPEDAFQDRDFFPLLANPCMGYIDANDLPNWEIKLFMRRDQVFLEMEKHNPQSEVGSCLPRRLPYINTVISHPLVHAVARQTLLFDEDIPGSLAADLRDCFFYARGRGDVSDLPNDWCTSLWGRWALKLNFYAGLQIGKAQIVDLNGLPDSAAIENGTRYAGFMRTIKGVADVQEYLDGRLGGVDTLLHFPFFRKVVNYGRPLDFPQAVGEDEQLKQAVRLILGGSLDYSNEDPSLAAQEKSWSAINVQDTQKYNATTDLVAQPLKRALMELFWGRLRGQRVVTYTPEHIIELLMQASWYFIPNAERTRKKAPIVFLILSGFVLPIPVDRAFFTKAFIFDMAASWLSYLFMRVTQFFGPRRALGSSPSKDLAYLANYQRGIDRLFPEKWEYGPFIGTRESAGTAKMPDYAHHFLHAYGLGEGLAFAAGAAHLKDAGISENLSTEMGIGINMFWCAYALGLTYAGIRWQKKFEDFERYDKASRRRIPPFALSAADPARSMEDQLLTWRAEVYAALNQLDAYTRDFTAASGEDKAFHKFLRSEYRQSILAFVQQVDMGLYFQARQMQGEGRSARAFALLRLLAGNKKIKGTKNFKKEVVRCRSVDKCVYKLATRALNRIPGRERRGMQAAINLEQARLRERLASIAQVVTPPINTNQVIADFVADSVRTPATPPRIDSLITDISINRGYAPNIINGLRAGLTALQQALASGNPAQVRAALNQLLETAPQNYLCRRVLQAVLQQRRTAVAEVHAAISNNLNAARGETDLNKKVAALEKILTQLELVKSLSGRGNETLLRDAREEIRNTIVSQIQSTTLYQTGDLGKVLGKIKSYRDNPQLCDLVNPLLETLSQHLASLKDTFQLTINTPPAGTNWQKLYDNFIAHENLSLTLMQERYNQEEEHRPTTARERILAHIPLLRRLVPLNPQFDKVAVEAHVQEIDNLLRENETLFKYPILTQIERAVRAKLADPIDLKRAQEALSDIYKYGLISFLEDPDLRNRLTPAVDAAAQALVEHLHTTARACQAAYTSGNTAELNSQAVEFERVLTEGYNLGFAKIFENQVIEATHAQIVSWKAELEKRGATP